MPFSITVRVVGMCSMYENVFRCPTREVLMPMENWSKISWANCKD
jgi:hypothetical protein